jgi:hypothetical protein
MCPDAIAQVVEYSETYCVGLPQKCPNASGQIVEYSQACYDGGHCTKDQWLASDWDEVGLPQRCPDAIAQIVEYSEACDGGQCTKDQPQTGMR